MPNPALTRTEAEARRDQERAMELDRLIKGVSAEPLPYPDPRAPTASEWEMELLNRQAKREAAKRRRLSRYARCLLAEINDRELSGKGVHPDERGALMDVLVYTRRALA